jgi:DNA-binding transcriptional LysR family regulator
MSGPLPIGIEFRHLRYFLALMEELHFGRAADRVHISQPPLSQAIQKLEAELGVQLFERTSRSVLPTEAAKVFAGEAVRVLRGLDVAVNEARRVAGVGPALRLGSMPEFPLESLRDLLDALEERAAPQGVEAIHLPPREEERRVRSGELDLAVLHGLEHPGLDSEPLFPGERLAVFLHPQHPLAVRDILGPEDLKSETLVQLPRVADPLLYDHMGAKMMAAGYRFTETREAGGTDLHDVMAAVASGLGIAVEVESLAEATNSSELVTRCRLDPPASWPDVVLAWRERPSRRLQPLVPAIREIAGELRRSVRSGRL